MEFAERRIRSDEPQARGPHGWLCREGLSLHEVEGMLDGLEAAGVSEREMSVEPAGTFTVRWRE